MHAPVCTRKSDELNTGTAPSRFCDGLCQGAHAIPVGQVTHYHSSFLPVTAPGECWSSCLHALPVLFGVFAANTATLTGTHSRLYLADSQKDSYHKWESMSELFSERTDGWMDG